MLELVPELIKVWDRWNIRGVMILSLTLQLILICFSPLRKRTPTRLFIMLVFSSYHLADWSAIFAVGLISKNQGKELKPDDPPHGKELMALWAQFLLLHLGGADTITALTLEDNALWLRHLFGLVFQVFAGGYVVFQSLPNSLWVIIVLVFVSGVIKYLEKTMALSGASFDKFRDSIIQAPDPGPNYAKLMEDYKAKKEARLPTKKILIDEHNKEYRPKKLLEHPSLASKNREDLTHLEIAQYAYKFFNTFKGLVVNLKFSFRERDESLEIFENLKTPDEALRIIEIELGFLYDTLFTKIRVLYTVFGASSRIVASGTLVTAFILFDKKLKKDKLFHGTDVVVTYMLFAVGIALDFISLILFMFSDWTCVALSSLKNIPKEPQTLKERYFNWLLGFRKLHWKPQECHKKGLHTCIKEGEDKCSMEHKHDVKRIHDARDSFSRYSCIIIALPFEILMFIIQKWISHRVNELSRNHPVARSTIYPIYFEFLSRIPHFIKSVFDVLGEFFGISDTLATVHKMLFVHGEPMMKHLWVLIFNELKYKSKFGDNPENAKSLSLARGEWTLRENLPEDVDCEKLLRCITNVDYDQSILMWHIATELCYQQEETNSEDEEKCEHYSYRELSKIISDYMMYLLILQPGLMSKVAGNGKIVFRDTLAEAEMFFQRRHIENKRSVKTATINILNVNSDTDPMEVKGDGSKSVLFDASRLAKDLMHLELRYSINKWEILSKVWVELLCYAACYCDSMAHVEQLSRGGELINFVWLLMAHFGLTDQFQINNADA
ncbi:hypothetical protein CARUB_v10028304mg [Capsella rubella]|uniref:DUF4220 domain-containing protein n=1 Tax=Capsella rubella TaxID=81985 RepID=R0F070_9BRAS|nr:hypothetical protein CARUB_v10028304mg [Capsella rubella]